MILRNLSSALKGAGRIVFKEGAGFILIRWGFENPYRLLFIDR